MLCCVVKLVGKKYWVGGVVSEDQSDIDLSHPAVIETIEMKLAELSDMLK